MSDFDEMRKVVLKGRLSGFWTTRLGQKSSFLLKESVRPDFPGCVFVKHSTMETRLWFIALAYSVAAIASYFLFSINTGLSVACMLVAATSFSVWIIGLVRMSRITRSVDKAWQEVVRFSDLTKVYLNTVVGQDLDSASKSADAALLGMTISGFALDGLQEDGFLRALFADKKNHFHTAHCFFMGIVRVNPKEWYYNEARRILAERDHKRLDEMRTAERTQAAADAITVAAADSGEASATDTPPGSSGPDLSLTDQSVTIGGLAT